MHAKESAMVVYYSNSIRTQSHTGTELSITVRDFLSHAVVDHRYVPGSSHLVSVCTTLIPSHLSCGPSFQCRSSFISEQSRDSTEAISQGQQARLGDRLSPPNLKCPRAVLVLSRSIVSQWPRKPREHAVSFRFFDQQPIHSSLLTAKRVSSTSKLDRASRCQCHAFLSASQV